MVSISTLNWVLNETVFGGNGGLCIFKHSENLKAEVLSEATK